MAQDKKSARRQRAHLVLIDESGFLMSPLVRRTLAPRGHTPILKTKGSRREKVSITAAMTVSPKRRRLGLYWRTFPRDYVTGERSADFLRYLLRHLRGKVDDPFPTKLIRTVRGMGYYLSEEADK